MVRVSSIRLHPPKPPVAYSIPEAALAVGVSEPIVRAAINDGTLPKHHLPQAPTKPLILWEDLVAWVRDSPTERDRDASH